MLAENLESAIALEPATDLDLTSNLESITTLALATSLESAPGRELSNNLKSPSALESVIDLELANDVELATALELIRDVESTTDMYLENTQPFKLSTHVESNTGSFEKQATQAMSLLLIPKSSWLEHQISPAHPTPHHQWDAMSLSQCLFKVKQTFH